MKKLTVGDKIYSKYFHAEIEIVAINSDTDWYFRLPGGKDMKALTALSYFENRQ